MPACAGDDISLFNLGDTAVTMKPRVIPGGALDVQLMAPNTGQRAWEPDEVRLVFAGDVSWKNAALSLIASTAPGATGVFTGRLSVSRRPGIHTLKWQADHEGERFGSPIVAAVEVTCEDGVFCNGTERFVEGGCIAGNNPCDDGQACTQDDCNESAGTCHHELGASCASCLSACVPDCTGKVCGDDGCGGSCGKCAGGSLCVPSTGQCQPLADCDHLLPACTPACGLGQFCGTDCACHSASDPMPDLVVDSKRLLDEILFDSVEVDSASCSIVEGCAGSTGTRRVLRFSVQAINQGPAPLTVPPPAERPDLFTFSPCHGHFHFNGFASYVLLARDGRTVLVARKQAYCIGDTQQIMLGPGVPCSKKYDCDNQGIQAGWSDLYGNALECQWLDVTDVAPGDYWLEVALNPGRSFEEVSFDNNTVTVPVTIPTPAP